MVTFYSIDEGVGLVYNDFVFASNTRCGWAASPTGRVGPTPSCSCGPGQGRAGRILLPGKAREPRVVCETLV